MADLPKELNPERFSHLSPSEQRKILSIDQVVDQIASFIIDYFIAEHSDNYVKHYDIS